MEESERSTPSGPIPSNLQQKSSQAFRADHPERRLGVIPKAQPLPCQERAHARNLPSQVTGYRIEESYH